MDTALSLILLSAGVFAQFHNNGPRQAPQDLVRRRISQRPTVDCPEWNEWQNATCWWPSQSWEELPEACTFVSASKKMPEYIQKLVELKAKEKYDIIQAEYNARGAPPKCGFCSRSFKCRTRNTTDDSFFCPQKQVLNVPSECNDSAPCLIKREKGGCPPPLFLNNNRIQKIRDLIEKKDHHKVMNELLAAQAPPKEDRGGFESSDPLPWEPRLRVKRGPMVDDDSAFAKVQYNLWGNPFYNVFEPRPISPHAFGDMRMMARPVQASFVMPMSPMAPQMPSQGHGIPMRPMRRLPKPQPSPPAILNDHGTIQMLKQRFGPFGPQILPFGPRNGFLPFFPPPPPFAPHRIPMGPPRIRRPRPSPQNLQFIHELVHGTTCASQLDVCLCCCGHFVPNVIKGTCEDITQILPGIENVVDDLMDKSKKTDETQPAEEQKEESPESESGPFPVPKEEALNSESDFIPIKAKAVLKLKPTAKFVKETQEFKL